jgi:Fe2+ transport system protein FeoA
VLYSSCLGSKTFGWDLKVGGGLLGFVSVGQTESESDDSLCGIPKGVVSTIEAVSGSESFQNRLKSVGIVTGSRIRVLRTGCPVIVHSEGGRFCLRKEDAHQIRVAPVTAEADA